MPDIVTSPDIVFFRFVACLMPFLIGWLVGSAFSRRLGDAAGAVALMVLALVAGWM